MLEKKEYLERLNTKAYSTETILKDYKQYVAGHYQPVKDLVIDEAKDYFVKTPEGKVLVDFFAAYSAINQGHSQPEILEATIKQLLNITITSGAFVTPPYAQLAKLVHETFGYDKMLPCSGGAEAVEAAIKILTRHWHNKMKEQNRPLPKQDKDTAILVWAKNGYHGQSAGVWPIFWDRESTQGFAPKLPNRRFVPYGDINALRKLFEKEGKNIAAFLIEPIQGEAGVIPPPPGYLKTVRELCTKHNILLVIDEIQAGLGRTGKMLCQEHEGVRADIITLAKSTTGGVAPLSLVLANNDIMKVLGPGDHGSTFGGNPLACAVAIAAIQFLKDKDLCKRSTILGAEFKNALQEKLGKFISIPNKSGLIKEIRGQGLMIGIEFTDSAIPFRDALIDAGIWCKQTKEKTLRITPPLTISREALNEFVVMIEELCILKSGGKNLQENPIKSMPQRLKENYNIEPDFDPAWKKQLLEKISESFTSQTEKKKNSNVVPFNSKL